VLTRSLFTIAALELLLVAGAGLVLAARLLADLREDESALLRARGATRWQVARPVLAEAVALGAAASLVGVLAGSRLTGVLASLGNLSLDGYASGGITPLAWLSALVVLVLCTAVMAWPALRTLTPGAARLRRSRQARLAGIAWAGGDLAVVALAAVSVWELHGYSAVAHPATGSLGIDPVVAVAPALALAGLALIPLRGLPLLARLAGKATDRERRLAPAMVSWQIARRPRPCRAPERGPELREQRPVPEHGAGARRDPRGRRRAALLSPARPGAGPDRGPLTRGGRVRWPGPGHPHPARHCLAVIRPGAGAGHGGVPGNDHHRGNPQPGGRIVAAGGHRRDHPGPGQSGDHPSAAAPDLLGARRRFRRRRSGRRGGAAKRIRAVGGVRRPGPVRRRPSPREWRPRPDSACSSCCSRCC
jgi:hypothetical protein